MTINQNILIVDDRPENLYTLERILNGVDAEVIQATSGNEALVASLNHELALAIIDVQMPEMDGYELAELLRCEERMRHLPIIFLSAIYSDELHIFKGYEAGGVDFITKPFNPDVLIAKVRVFLQLERNREELRRAHDLLEVRVQERTAELAAANAALKEEIEERQRANEERIIYITKLEQSNRELEDFAFVASHDLQEPLRKIQTFSDRLRKKHETDLDASSLDYLLRVQRSAERMQALINDLLKFSRVSSRKEPFTAVDLRAAVEDAAANLSVAIEESRGHIEVGELPVIEADPTQMGQLFQNLIGNALKYCSQCEPLVRVYSASTLSNRFCEIRVEDNGIGFDEAYLDKIFKPFQRLHARTAPYQGTGMGLAICRRIVERHGGNITARSKPGEGSTFIVTLPKNQPRAANIPS